MNKFLLRNKGSSRFEDSLEQEYFFLRLSEQSERMEKYIYEQAVEVVCLYY